MAFEAYYLELVLFLSLLKILASLPTDPYFHSWHDSPPSYRISQDSYQPHLGNGDPRIDGSGFGQRNFSRSLGDPSLSMYRLHPRDEWYRFEHGGRRPQDERRNLPSRRQWEFEGGTIASRRRNSEATPGGEHPENIQRNSENSYSSHVNCEATNQKEEMGEKAPKNIRENIEPIFGSSIPGMADERINFEDGSRNLRTGNSKEADVASPRIVTPKGGRRPPQGSSSKNKPFNPGLAIPNPTTEKTSRNQTTKGSKKPRPNNSKPQGGEIVFPDGYQKKFVPKITKCGKKSTFCEHVGEEYPTDYINQVLKREGDMFREFFGRDVISDPNITERINAPEENSLCPYRQEVVFPRAAQNKDDKWLFIINQDQYVQGVTVEVCLNPESRCILTEGFPLGYTPYCKQKYIERRLVAIGEDGKPHSDSFRLPSCCSCVVKHETSARTGLLRSSRRAPAPP